ncbi:MAG: DUF58 domain-containing protein [Chitinophagales bacterium]|nr:DUF58 domain-containing protein [Chitinophagales bacterium]
MSLETKELLKKVRKIEIKSKGLSNHIFSGAYHSAFKGKGMLFSEVREYQYGDDIRAIDWNVTARFNHPYVKLFEEERELTVMLLIDVSQSSFFGTQKAFKSDIIAEISAVIAFSAIVNNDKVGVIFFSDKIEKFIPPKKGRTHILRIIRELVNVEPQHKGTDIAQAIKYLNQVTKKRAIVFLLSDFLADGFQHALTIARKKHDITGIHLFDPLEASLPNVGLIKVLDSESGSSYWVDSSDDETRQKYEATYEAKMHRCKSAFLKAGADLISISTQASYIQSLTKFFNSRV